MHLVYPSALKIRDVKFGGLGFSVHLGERKSPLSDQSLKCSWGGRLTVAPRSGRVKSVFQTNSMIFFTQDCGVLFIICRLAVVVVFLKFLIDKFNLLIVPP